MSGFRFGTNSSSTISPFSFASSSSPSPFSSTSPFGSSQSSTTPNPPFGAPSNPSAPQSPAMSFGFWPSPAPASCTLFSASVSGNAATSSHSGRSTLFGSSSGTTTPLNLFGSSSNSGNSSNLFGTSSVSVNTSKLFGANLSSRNASRLFRSRKGPVAGSSGVFGSSSDSGVASDIFGSSSGSNNNSNLFGSCSAAGSASRLFGSTSSSGNLFGASSELGNASSSGFGTFSAGSGNASNLFASTSVFGNSSSLFVSTSSNPVSTFGVSASTSPSFPNLFGTPSIKPSSSLTLPCSLSSSSSSSSSAPSFSLSGGFGSGLTNGGFSFSTTSPFSGFTSTVFSSSTVVSSGSFLFGTPSVSQSQSSTSAPSAAVSNSKPSSTSFGTDSSPLFSTVTTTSVDSMPATTTTTTTTTTLSVASTPMIPAFGVTGSTDGKDASVAITESFPCFVSSSFAATLGTASSDSGVLLSTEAAGTAMALQLHTSVASNLSRIPLLHGGTFWQDRASSQCSSNLHKAFLYNEKEVNLALSEGEIKQLKEIIRLVAEFQDKEIRMGALEGSKTHNIKVKVPGLHGHLESSFLLTEGQLPMVPQLEGTLVTLPSEKLDAVKRGLNSPHKEILEGLLKEVSGHETVLRPPFSSSQLMVNNKFTSSSQNDLIIKQIFDKYGDITSGSLLKSTTAKSTFLSLVAGVVERLSNHTLDTIEADELQLIEMQIADAAAVGFYVDWLHQRVDQIIAASKYNLHIKKLDELGKMISAAKRSVMEMELEQLILKKEIFSLKAEMEGDMLSESNLVEGLL